MGLIANRHLRRIAAWLSLSTAAMLVFTGGAGAASLNGGGFTEYAADAGEVNNVTLTRSGINLVFTDAPGTTINATLPCTAAANVGTCPVADVFQVQISLDDMNDSAAADASVTGFDNLHLVGGGGNDTLTNGGDVEFASLTGDDGAPEGDDTLIGGTNRDNIFGGGGNDTISGGTGNDFFNPGDGNDQVSGGAGFDQFESDTAGADGVDVFSGGSEIDSLDLGDREAAVTVSLNDAADDGQGCPGPGCEGDNYRADVENVEGGQANDVLIGNAGLNDFDGESGDDTLSGGGAYDELFGGRGNDTLNGEAGNDEMVGNNGADRLFGGQGDDYTFGDYFDENTDILSGGPGIDGVGIAVNAIMPIRIDLDNRADDGFNSSLVPGPRDNVKPNVENLDGGPGPDVLIGNGRPNELRRRRGRRPPGRR